MKPLAVPLSVLLVALVVGCTMAPSSPAGDADPIGRWRRGSDGLIASGIGAFKLETKVENDGNHHVLTTNFPQQEVHDPLEDIPEFKRIFAYANREAGKRTAKDRGQLGAIHSYWSEKKKILRDQFGIDWKSPAELNPMTSYD